MQGAMLDHNMVCYLLQIALSGPEAADWEIPTSRKVSYSAIIIMLTSAKDATASWICTESLL